MTAEQAGYRWWPTMPEPAVAMRRELESVDEDMALRFMLDGTGQLSDAHEQGGLGDAIAEPESIGDVRWDTLLAASVRYRLHQMGEAAPVWTLKEPLKKFWAPVNINDSQIYNAWAHSPAEMLQVGIFFDDRNFTGA